MSNGTRYAPFLLVEGGYLLGPHHNQWASLFRKVFIFTHCMPDVINVWTVETAEQKTVVIAAWFFIRSFGPDNDYTMPWSEIGQLVQFIRHCRGCFPSGAAWNPGEYIAGLCLHYQPLFTVDPGRMRIGCDWETREHDCIRA